MPDPCSASPANLASLSDEQLVAAVGQGDSAAFEGLVSRYQNSAWRTARRFLGDAHEAEDITQEAFLQVFRHARHFKAEASFKTWFFRILTNLCLNQRQKKKPEYFAELPVELPARDNPAYDLELRAQQAALERALHQLPANQRLAFLLCCSEEFSYAEAAQSLGLSVKAVESLLVRARRSLRTELAALQKK